MIRFDDVTMVYTPGAQPALDHVSLEVEREEFVFLVGKSGSGKSTFLQLVMREMKATSGKVWVLGKDVSKLSTWAVPKLRRKIGTVFQDFRLLPSKTVYENVALAMQGGEEQRVAIARAMVNRPELLLADEPTGNLDPETSLGIMRLLDRINRSGTTVVMATHDADIVNQMRKRVIELEAGDVVRDQNRGVYGAGR